MAAASMTTESRSLRSSGVLREEHVWRVQRLPREPVALPKECGRHDDDEEHHELEPGSVPITRPSSSTSTSDRFAGAVRYRRHAFGGSGPAVAMPRHQLDR